MFKEMRIDTKVAVIGVPLFFLVGYIFGYKSIEASCSVVLLVVAYVGYPAIYEIKADIKRLEEKLDNKVE